MHVIVRSAQTNLERYAKIFIQELRPYTFILFGFHVCIGFAYAWKEAGVGTFTNAASLMQVHGWVLLGCLTILAAWYVVSVAVNDISDEAIDAINMKNANDRPLQNGSATRKELKILVVFMVATSVFISALMGLMLLLLTIGMLIVSWAYSSRPLQLSHRGVVAPLILPVGYVLFPMLMGPVVYGVEFSRQYGMLVCGLYAVFVSRVMLKDFRDIVGDRTHNKKTFLLQTSHVFVCWSSMVFCVVGAVLVAVALSIYPIYWLTLGIITVLLVLGISQLSVIYKLRIWKTIKPHLSWYGRYLSLISATVFAVILFATQSVDMLTYIVLLGIIMLATIINYRMSYITTKARL